MAGHVLVSIFFYTISFDIVKKEIGSYFLENRK